MTKDYVQVLKSTSRSKFPGLLDALNIYCRSRANITVYEAIIKSPELILEALRRMYNNKDVVKYIVIELFIKPLTTMTGARDKPEDLFEVFVNNPLEFKERVLKVIDF